MIEDLLVGVVDNTYRLLYVMIIVRIIATWIPLPYHPVLKQVLDFIYIVTEPILKLFRGLIPGVSMGGAMLDLSPIIAIFVLSLARSVLVGIIYSIF